MAIDHSILFEKRYPLRHPWITSRVFDINTNQFVPTKCLTSSVWANMPNNYVKKSVVVCPKCRNRAVYAEDDVGSYMDEQLRLHVPDKSSVWICPVCGFSDKEVSFLGCALRDLKPDSQYLNMIRVRKRRNGLSLIVRFACPGHYANIDRVYERSLLFKIVFNLETYQTYILAPINHKNESIWKQTGNQAVRCVSSGINFFFFSDLSESLKKFTSLFSFLSSYLADYYYVDKAYFAGNDLRLLAKKLWFLPYTSEYVTRLLPLLSADESSQFHKQAKELRRAQSNKNDDAYLKYLAGNHALNVKSIRTILKNNIYGKYVLRMLWDDFGFRDINIIRDGLSKYLTVFHYYEICSHTNDYINIYQAGEKITDYCAKFAEWMAAAIPNERLRLRVLVKVVESKPCRSFSLICTIADIVRFNNANDPAEQFKHAVTNALREGEVYGTSFVELIEQNLIRANKQHHIDAIKEKVIPPLAGSERLNVCINDYSFRVAAVGYDLITLGEKLHNCVSGYFSGAAIGMFTIVGIYDKKGKPVGCIQTDQKCRKIVQARAPCNKLLEGSVRDAFGEWAKRCNIIVQRE